MCSNDKDHCNVEPSVADVTVVLPIKKKQNNRHGGSPRESSSSSCSFTRKSDSSMDSASVGVATSPPSSSDQVLTELEVKLTDATDASIRKTVEHIFAPTELTPVPLVSNTQLVAQDWRQSVRFNRARLFEEFQVALCERLRAITQGLADELDRSSSVPRYSSKRLILQLGDVSAELLARFQTDGKSRDHSWLYVWLQLTIGDWKRFRAAVAANEQRCGDDVAALVAANMESFELLHRTLLSRRLRRVRRGETIVDPTASSVIVVKSKLDDPLKMLDAVAEVLRPVRRRNIDPEEFRRQRNSGSWRRVHQLLDELDEALSNREQFKRDHQDHLVELRRTRLLRDRDGFAAEFESLRNLVVERHFAEFAVYGRRRRFWWDRRPLTEQEQAVLKQSRRDHRLAKESRDICESKVVPQSRVVCKPTLRKYRPVASAAQLFVLREVEKRLRCCLGFDGEEDGVEGEVEEEEAKGREVDGFVAAVKMDVDETGDGELFTDTDEEDDLEGFN